MSKLLVSEHPLIVLPSLAKALKNVNAAIVLQQIHYWISDPRAPERDGLRWHYATYNEWLEQFSWICIRTLKSTMQFLEESNLVISKEFNQLKGDRTKWYTINYEALHELELSLNTHSATFALPSGKTCTPIVQKLHDVYKEEETTKETTKENNNNKDRLTQKGTIVKEDDVVVALRKDLIEIGIVDTTLETVIKSYTTDKIREYIDWVNDPKTTVKTSKAGLFINAIKSNWHIPAHKSTKAANDDLEIRKKQDLRVELDTLNGNIRQAKDYLSSPNISDILKKHWEDYLHANQQKLDNLNIEHKQMATN